MHYSAIYDMFRPYKWAIIRLLVEPMGRLYTRIFWGENEISSYVILWGSRLLILHMTYGYYLERFGVYHKFSLYAN